MKINGFIFMSCLICFYLFVCVFVFLCASCQSAPIEVYPSEELGTMWVKR